MLLKTTEILESMVFNKDLLVHFILIDIYIAFRFFALLIVWKYASGILAFRI